MMVSGFLLGAVATWPETPPMNRCGRVSPGRRAIDGDYTEIYRTGEIAKPGIPVFFILINVPEGQWS